MDVKLRFSMSRRVVTTAETFQIHVKNENDPWCVLAPISQLLHCQNSKSRTVLKSSEPADFKTVLFKFGEDLMEILMKNKSVSFFVDTVYINKPAFT